MREKYLQMRKLNHFDLNWFYKYYQEKFNTTKQNTFLPFEIFTQLFQIYLQENMNEILKRLDIEYEVQLLENKQGEVIYIN